MEPSKEPTFKRREGTAGICGHLYETKLLSLLYFRALHNDRIVEFQLASNVDKIGNFDDICFKARVEGFDKPLFVFIQAKHKENKKQTFKFDLSPYFISYLNIRQQFDANNTDLFFKGIFEEAECLFVLYTPARDEFREDLSVESCFSSNLDDLIDTGGTAKQPYKLEEDVQLLCKVALNEQMISLAERIAEVINNEVNFQNLLNYEHTLRYHVILAQRVVKVTDHLQKEGHRLATFRPDFFEDYNEYLTVFRETLCKKIVEKRKIEHSDIEQFLTEFLAEPSDATKLSKLIGSVITYNNGLIEIRKKYTQFFRAQLKQVDVSRFIVNQAIEIAAKEILLSQDFIMKVPASFGNKDMTIGGNEEKQMQRIRHLTTKIINLLKECGSSKIVTIDESLEDGLLRLNGGIAGAIGNLFVLEDNTKLMKITDNPELLGTLSKLLYDSLNEKIQEMINDPESNTDIRNLSEYKFCIRVNKFPKLLLEFNEYEESLAKDFLNKLIIYSNQSDETEVQDQLKDEVEESLDPSDYSQSKTDAILLRYHNEIQSWWMQPKEAPYLHKNSKMFEKAASCIIEDTVMSSLSLPFTRTIKQLNYSFTENAVKALRLGQSPTTFIITDNSVLTLVKVMQHLKNKDHIVLDLEEIVTLKTKERNDLRKELTNTNKDKVVTLVCNNISMKEKIILKNIAEAVKDKKTIIVTSTNEETLGILRRYFETPNSNTVVDEKNCLIDMSEKTQMTVLMSARVRFQDLEVGLGDLVEGLA